ncbi:MAG: gliding motility-associated ABC transporter ATP-binding subunit GldA [Vicingaceae bacterium]
MSISVHNVSKYYGTQKALDNVSFEVKAGEIIGFLGPNGAGKSTMMKIICGYLPQNEGSVKVCGMDVLEEELAVKQRLGYLPENNPLYLDMYVKEYLLFTAGIYKLANKESRVQQVIDKVGITKEQNKRIGELSKGYRQRVGLAQSFIHEPDVLILDEPTTGLDPNQIVEIRNLIREIGKNKTVLLSTHIMQEVEAICDRAIIINEGKIVEDSSVADLKKLNEGERKIEVLFKQPVEEKALSKLFGSGTVLKLSSSHYEITANDMLTCKNQIMNFAMDNGYEILQMNERGSSLEEIFRKLTIGSV